MTKLTSIVKAKQEDYQLLSEMGTTTFIESHGHSASVEDISSYVSEKFSYDTCKQELSDPKNIYYFIYYNNQPAGYSKIILDNPFANINLTNVTKLERIYLLKEFHGLSIGLELFNFNLALSKKNNQQGIWLFVWTENHRAVNFYKKLGFNVVGNYDFPIGKTHTNPNYQMFIEY